MKQDKTYEEKILDIKKYLQEKEAEISRNKKNQNDINIKNKDILFDEDNTVKEDDYYKKIRTETRAKENTIKIDIEKIQKENNPKHEAIKPKNNKKINIILILLLLLSPLFISLSIISFNTVYLIHKPFNYIIHILSVLSLVSIVCILLIKKSNNKNKKTKYIIASIITILIDAIIMAFCLKGKFWTKLDPLIENKKLLLIVMLLVLIIFAFIIIIRKRKHKKIKENIRKYISTIFLTLYVMCYANLLITLYGPAKEFKEWLITTAMQTMHHQYFCKWFYSSKDIEYVLNQNYVLESGESTDASLIKKQEEEKVVYENEYEEAVLKIEHKNDLYKIIELDVNGCKGYLAVIYDPTTVHVAVTNKVGRYGQYVTDMAKDRGAVLAINGGGFNDPGYSGTGGYPIGATIVDGKIITNGEYGWNVQTGGIIGFDKEGILHLLKNKDAKEALEMGIVEAISMGPFLIVNGNPSFIKGNGGWGYAARTAIGQRADGIVLFLTVDSNATRTKGADMVDLTEIMQNYGAINAANLDGGTSTVMVMPKETALKYNPNCTDDYCNINDPIDGALRHQTRAIADAFVVIPNE